MRGKPNRAGKHQFRQRQAVVFCYIGIHRPERVIRFRISAGNFIYINIFIKMFLPAGQDPIAPENVPDAALAAAQHTGIKL